MAMVLQTLAWPIAAVLAPVGVMFLRSLRHDRRMQRADDQTAAYMERIRAGVAQRAEREWTS